MVIVSKSSDKSFLFLLGVFVLGMMGSVAIWLLEAHILCDIWAMYLTSMLGPVPAFSVMVGFVGFVAVILYRPASMALVKLDEDRDKTWDAFVILAGSTLTYLLMWAMLYFMHPLLT
jgi:RsiW-degrading membrane proteinase PrsW (M82 family)